MDMLNNLLSIDPVAWLIIIGFSILAIINIKLVQGNKKIKQRHLRFITTMISKKYFAWFFITNIWLFDRYVSGKEDFSILMYLGFTCTVFGIDIVQKKLALNKGKN